MSKTKLCCVFLCLAFCTIQSQATISLIPGNSARASKPIDSQDLPLYAPYGVLFKRIALESSTDSNLPQSYKKTINSRIRAHYDLDENQAAILKEVASNCMNTVKQLDAQAQQIIDAARSAYLKNSKPNQKPICPPELHSLQILRDNAIIASRDRLVKLFGSSKFISFDRKVKDSIAKSVRRR